MTFRHTVCTLALIAGAAVSGCNSEKSETQTETRQGTSEAAEQAATSGFGMHLGSYEQAEGLTEIWTTPERGGSRILYYDPEPFITGAHIAEFTESRDANGNPAVGLRFTEDGAGLLRATTSERIGEPIVFTVNGEVLSAPTVRSALSRVAMVTGDGDTEWIGHLETILAETGAEKVDSFPQPEPEIPPAALGIGVFVASTQRSEFFFIEFPDMDGLTLYGNDQPLLLVDHFAGATRTTDQTGNPAIRLELNEAGKAIMQDRAEVYVGHYLVPSWQGRPINAVRVMRELDDTILVSDAEIDPDLAENWMDALDASLSD